MRLQSLEVLEGSR